MLKSVKAAKLIENKKLKIEILKYNALDYANEKIYGLYNNNQDMLNADLLNELSILINAIPSKKERKAVLEIVVKYYHHCKVNDLGLKQIREALNKSSK